jgi:hypothetical protein
MMTITGKYAENNINPDEVVFYIVTTRTKADAEPVGMKMTAEMQRMNDGKAGLFLWFCDIEDGSLLYARPPKADADGCAVCGEVYQVVGALWNGQSNLVPVLDNLSASATGKPIPHDTLLPFVPKADAERVALRDAMKRNDLIGRIDEVGDGENLEILLRDIRAYLQGGA